MKKPHSMVIAMQKLLSHIARRVAPVGAAVVLAVLVATPAHAQAAPSDSAARLKPVVVTAAPGLSDSMQVMLAGHLADSATLANLSQHDRVVRLAQDNRFLTSVTRDQDKRIDALEKRMKALAAQRQQIKQLGAPPAAPPESRNSLVKQIETMQQRLDSLERVRQASSGQPHSPGTR